jgi:excisionase family DNA binding protein
MYSRKCISEKARQPSDELQYQPSSTPAIEIMTAKEVASLLKISAKTVYSYARRNMIPTYWKFQNNIRFEKRQILEWMKEANQADPPRSPRRVA